jgi:peptidoglycan hydrolase CwlO-like protein
VTAPSSSSSTAASEAALQERLATLERLTSEKEAKLRAQEEEAAREEARRKAEQEAADEQAIELEARRKAQANSAPEIETFGSASTQASGLQQPPSAMVPSALAGSGGGTESGGRDRELFPEVELKM